MPRVASGPWHGLTARWAATTILSKARSSDSSSMCDRSWCACWWMPRRARMGSGAPGTETGSGSGAAPEGTPWLARLEFAG
jgi:hypothetical protein